MPRPRAKTARTTIRRIAVAALAACGLGASSAQANGLGPYAANCHDAGIEAERQYGLPAGLMAAIGQTESGRFDPVSGRVAAYPWTINAAGRGHHFADRGEAIRAVQDLALRGVRSIDVGCYQVNLMYHPTAFSTLEQAFDPATNAMYAAKFLASLQARTGSWDSAIAAYHSASPGAGEAYRNRVFAAWTNAPAGRPMAASAGIMIPVSTQFAPTGRAATPPGAANTWTVAAQTMGIRIWTPGAVRPGTSAAAPLPRVIAGRP